jgi:hypothetical protein
LKSNGTSTKPLKRTPIPRAKHNWKTHGHWPLFPKIQTQLKTQLTTTYFVVKMGVDIVTLATFDIENMQLTWWFGIHEVKPTPRSSRLLNRFSLLWSLWNLLQDSLNETLRLKCGMRYKW